jgi:hypothetical protein
MRVFECPDKPHGGMEARLFLAGGITGCPDWQKEMIARFAPKQIGGKPGPDEFPNLFLMNPRRATFDVTKPEETKFQIRWEFNQILRSDAVLFWFPYNTLCPITLYELGVSAARGDEIFVGAHPAYSRKTDIEEQLSLIRPEVKVRDNFADLVDDITTWYGTFQ